MSNQQNDSMEEPTNKHYVALWQLQDIETTIADSSPEELPELHSKLLALSSGITEAIEAYAQQVAREHAQSAFKKTIGALLKRYRDGASGGHKYKYVRISWLEEAIVEFDAELDKESKT